MRNPRWICIRSFFVILKYTVCQYDVKSLTILFFDMSMLGTTTAALEIPPGLWNSLGKWKLSTQLPNSIKHTGWFLNGGSMNFYSGLTYDHVGKYSESQIVHGFQHATFVPIKKVLTPLLGKCGNVTSWQQSYKSVFPQESDTEVKGNQKAKNI